MESRRGFLEMVVRIICCHRCREKADARPSSTVEIIHSTERPTSTTSHDSGVAEDFADHSQEKTTQGSMKAGSIVVAVYDYYPACHDDLQFKKGDKMRILDKSDGDWWKAIHLKTKKKGSIPSNYVAASESVECEEWYHGDMLRKEAEKLLLNSGQGDGTFLIRKSERVIGGYALSLLHWNVVNKAYSVNNYVISVASGQYSVKEAVTFGSLHELVNFYSEDSCGLITRLSSPCPKPQPHLWDLSSGTKENWEMDRNEFRKDKLLGEGNYGQVWLGHYLGDVPAKVAIKTLKPGMMSPQAFVAEAAIMKTLRHRNLVSLYAVCSKEEPIWIVTEYIANGSLLAYLRGQKRNGLQLELDVLIDMATQVAHGMSYLETRQLIHRDLAARNILVGDNNLIKIADFGLARLTTDDVYEPSSNYACPVKWAAPEVYLYNRCTIKSDVWSFGILLMEIVTYGDHPYRDMSNAEVYTRVPLGYRMFRPQYDDCPEALYDLMRQCWKKEPIDRPKFDFLYSFLSDYAVNKTQYD